MDNELLNKWVEEMKALGISDDVISSMKEGWEWRLSELEKDLGQDLHADVVSGLLPIDAPDELAIRQEQRMADAIELGLDLSQIEALNAAERSNRG